ncbi:hypothetical protein SAMD00019534_062570 [Acytostelium subglobosum LB1]|uniref:hypothetical protein n=1 Tax=Acytostelium subglobosum LB1 TaxID=1410327 RepID=UPI0006451E51|nr:hypothetical protein SAMD00019534_062570 [Acytostelium subglobosum LB1]GAM23082.1 hypothetical protein SAMD00019534_062570 [Acytostelium subglobosum LB1]|eukprot:XP_012754309.1 hypothetical protein SAMD00019534_062570 [Acytostelium subglobosum LB1]
MTTKLDDIGNQAEKAFTALYKFNIFSLWQYFRLGQILYVLKMAVKKHNGDHKLIDFFGYVKARGFHQSSSTIDNYIKFYLFVSRSPNILYLDNVLFSDIIKHAEQLKELFNVHASIWKKNLKQLIKLTYQNKRRDLVEHYNTSDIVAMEDIQDDPANGADEQEEEAPEPGVEEHFKDDKDGMDTNNDQDN